MAQTKVAYQDGKGQFHATAEASTVSDFTALFGNAALGRAVFEARDEVERIFREHDWMLAPSAIASVAKPDIAEPPLTEWEKRWEDNPDGPGCA